MAKQTVKTGKGKVAGKTVDAQREFLAKELKGLIPKLDSEGLAFLVEQARVHLYNMQVDELNDAADAANKASVRAKSLAGKPATKGSAKAGNFRITGTESGSSYYLYYGNGDVMFSKDEMVRLVKIANGEGSDLEIRERLYNWFDRERSDVFAIVPIAGKTDPRLKALAELIRKNFKLRK